MQGISPQSLCATRHTNRFRRTNRLRRGTSEESGFVLMFFGLFLTALMAISGLSLDIGNWYLQALRLQHAADAAALAGSVYLPNDLDTAKAVANQTLASNGISGATVNVTQNSLHPSQLQVQITKTIPSHFASFVGFDSLTLSRNATAEYRPYIPMGSPSNVLGEETVTGSELIWQKVADQAKQQQYWLNISAGGNNKSSGDRYSAGQCADGVDGCISGRSGVQANEDYAATDSTFSASQQVYVVRVSPNLADGTPVHGALAIQAFDPEYANVGDNCELTNNLNAAATAMDPVRYASGNGPFCTGDYKADGSGGPTDTTFALYTPETASSHSEIVDTGSCQSQTFTGYDGQIDKKLNKGGKFAAAFRKWFPLCTLNIDTSDFPPGDYLLHVSTPSSQAGQNRYALRAAIVDSDGVTPNATMTTAVSLFAQGRLVVYANVDQSQTSFFLAKIPSSASGHQLDLSFFDIGDADSPVNLEIVPPDEATLNGSPISTFNGCLQTLPDDPAYSAADTMIDPDSNRQNPCSITGMTNAGANGRAGYDGKIVHLQIPVPVGYQCDDQSNEGCWIRLKLFYGNGHVQDTTSWEVGLDGQPVHLLPNTSQGS